MRKLKGSGNYLKSQTWKNFAKASVSLIIFGLLFFALSLKVLATLELTVFEVVGFLISLVPLGAFYFFLRRYRIYRGGSEGEKRVDELLNSKLSDDFYLINDLYLRDGGGDIDHIVFGPNGVFVLETKNWRGKITCQGDEWHRQNRKLQGSPSMQVKRNAAKIERIINSSPFRTLGIQVEGLVVFTNNRAQLHLNNPTVPIMKLNQLPSHLTTHKTQNRYTSQQLEAIVKEILKHKR